MSELMDWPGDRVVLGARMPAVVAQARASRRAAGARDHFSSQPPFGLRSPRCGAMCRRWVATGAWPARLGMQMLLTWPAWRPCAAALADGVLRALRASGASIVPQWAGRHKRGSTGGGHGARWALLSLARRRWTPQPNGRARPNTRPMTVVARPPMGDWGLRHAEQRAANVMQAAARSPSSAIRKPRLSRLSAPMVPSSMGTAEWATGGLWHPGPGGWWTSWFLRPRRRMAAARAREPVTSTAPLAEIGRRGRCTNNWRMGRMGSARTMGAVDMGPVWPGGNAECQRL